MGGGEIFLIVLVVYLVFGPRKIPEIARTLGKGINEIKRATGGVTDELRREIKKVEHEVKSNLDDTVQHVKKTIQDGQVPLSDVEKEIKDKMNKNS
jgi:sec-independent protein translocase protein TatA